MDFEIIAVDLCVLFLFHFNFQQSYFASRNAKGAVAILGNRPSDVFSFSLPISHILSAWKI